MPLQIPNLDDRRYQELLDSALARIPVHTPEWTNFNRSDPGVTLIEVFAFLTESLLYRSNQIPERNRRKFLSLLNIPLLPASSARGIVAFANPRGALEAVTLTKGLELSAGNVPFRLDAGLDVLPIEAPVFYKRRLDPSSDPQLAQQRQYYADLYASYLDPADPQAADRLQFYETVPFESTAAEAGVDLSQTVDGSLWMALMIRPNDDPSAQGLAAARAALAGKTLTLGIVPASDDPARVLRPGGQAGPEAQGLLQFYLPAVPASGGLPADRQPRYQPLQASSIANVLLEPGVVQIMLPDAGGLTLWNNLDPLEAGVQDLPPALDDTNKERRVLTWLRLRAATGTQARLMWVGANAAMVSQQATVAAEPLGEGTGEPDQVVTLARAPVLPGSLRLTVTPPAASPETWQEIDDLVAAGPEVPSPDLRQPPGRRQAVDDRVNVFALDAEAGVVRFGDGLRGRRPPLGALLRADYAYGVGRAGNVGAGAIKKIVPGLPIPLTVTNPVRTWGGADAETVAEGEKQITRYLQHRDRLVSAEDFATITRRTPGVDIGRVEVLPAYHPKLSAEPGDAAGAVTLLLLPAYDPIHPDAPQPDAVFLNSICAYLDPRRLVTTEIFLRGPDYVPIWVSAGMTVQAGYSIAQAREAVRKALTNFLSPYAWPLRKPIIDRELMAVASRVEGVVMVNQLLMAMGADAPVTEIHLDRLELPQVLGIAIGIGEAMPLDDLRGQAAPIASDSGRFVPVPVIPEECR